VLYEETTQTLLCGDLFAHVGDVPALTEADVVGPAMAGMSRFLLNLGGWALPDERYAARASAAIIGSAAVPFRCA
jgi:hypothetical protein